MRAIRYTAAGGVVVNGGTVLILHRPGRDEVRLPKGHVEPGEALQEAALREVSEESGYTNLEVVADLGHQVVEFDYQGNHAVRDEFYFLMRLRDMRLARREKVEAQFIPAWLSWDQALAQLSFEAEREWVRRAKSREGGRTEKGQDEE